jgi:hypothetical protein
MDRPEIPHADKEEQLTAKALELAILSLGQNGVSFEDEHSDWYRVPDELRKRAHAIRRYILKEYPGENH